MRCLFLSVPTQILIFNIGKYYTHCIPASVVQFFLHVMAVFFSKQQDRAVSCPDKWQQMAPQLSLHTSLEFGYNQGTSQSRAILTCFKTLWTSSCLFCVSFLRLLWERLWAVKKNNAGTCCSSTRCKLQTKGVVTGRSVVMRVVKVSTEGEVNTPEHTCLGKDMFSRYTRVGMRKGKQRESCSESTSSVAQSAQKTWSRWSLTYEL